MMNDSKHTPGPWRISESVHPQNACINIVAGEWGDDIASLYGPDRGVTQDESGVWGDHPIREANARMIAASPEMYEALHDLIALVETLDGGEHDDAPELVAARAAIAKAETR